MGRDLCFIFLIIFHWEVTGSITLWNKFSPSSTGIFSPVLLLGPFYPRLSIVRIFSYLYKKPFLELSVKQLFWPPFFTSAFPILTWFTSFKWSPEWMTSILKFPVLPEMIVNISFPYLMEELFVVRDLILSKLLHAHVTHGKHIWDLYRYQLVHLFLIARL